MSYVSRKRLGDRTIVLVCTLVAVSVAVLLGFAILVAQRVDQQGAQRELDLAREGLASLKVQMGNDLHYFAHWDEAVDLDARSTDPNWIHRHFGLHLYDTGRYDRAYIVRPDGEALYSSADGLLLIEMAYARAREKVDPLVRDVRRVYAEARAAHAVTGEVLALEPPAEPKFLARFARIDNRPALVGAVTIIPNPARVAGADADPYVAVAVAFINERLLETFSRKIAINQVRLEEYLLASAAGSSGDITLKLPMDASEAPAWLVWTPTATGAAMLTQLMPGLLGIAAVIGLVTILLLLHFRSTTERLVHTERRAKELAYRDKLTGLANRMQLLESLGDILADTQDGRRLALFLADIDGFKDINDTLGHPVGDEVLFATGERLSSVTGERGMAVRFGGDEFALLLPLNEGEEIDAICGRIVDSMRAPIPASGQYLTVGVTVGVAVAPDDADEPEQLLRRADIALYRAKAEDRGGFRLFDMRHEELLHKRSSMERDLARALENEELGIVFQPLYAADGERIVGVEALARWNDRERGLVSPSDFIPIAEQSGLITKLDEWIVRRACENAARWPGLSLSVNLSPSNFRRGTVVAWLTRVLSETRFDPRRLEVEITETMLLGANAEVLGELSALRRLGIRIALDDFGTGYSSLGYLRRFPVDKIKIDKSFVQNLGITEDAAAIVECVTRLGRALGLAVTAEGVETGEQHRFVRAVGCHQVQGFLFSPPVSPEQVAGLVGAKSQQRMRDVPRLAAG